MSTPASAAFSAGSGDGAELHAHLPAPPSERRAWLLAGLVAAVGLAAFLAVLTGVVGRAPALAPPPIPAVAPTPAPAAGGDALAGEGASGAIVAMPSSEQQSLDGVRFSDPRHRLIARSWVQAFYPLYAGAQRTFGVDWLLLASIHMQESAFSTAAGTYTGLNFAHCCGGPMQFNVTNGPTTTWDLVSGSYLYARRPATYDHMTTVHPSIYDDFDAIMAAGHLLAADGAGMNLDGSAWVAAYDYYGHDATGVLYADQVLARAIGWSQHGFCINCSVRPDLLQAVHAAYGAPVLAALEAQAVRPNRAAARRRGRQEPSRGRARTPARARRATST
jgi:hypothetical protein